MSELKLYNTMARHKMPFEPLDPAEVKLYTCGPTVYNYAHIGNLRTYVFEDLLRRVLEFNGYQVNHVMNITDVGHLTSDADEGEDKMLKGAQREKKTVWEIAEFYTKAFMSDMKALNLLEPHIKCKATDHIQEMIDQVKKLEENGLTYIANGNVYFDTSKIPDYGKLARLNEQELQAGARIEVDKGKKNPTDFVLWFTKSKFEDQTMRWESPWGKGYPGWHIECSAMSIRYLGNQIDIHCGGIDHIPVHHTNEIAQAEGATNIRPWVLYWMHGNFLVITKLKNLGPFYEQICPYCSFINKLSDKLKRTHKKNEIICEKCGKVFIEIGEAVIEGQKMAKSGDNFITLKTVIDKGYSPLDYRFFCLYAHYRKELMFTWESLDGAKEGRKTLYNTTQYLRDILNSGNFRKKDKEDDKRLEILNNKLEEFENAINDDLNMPKALSIVFNVVGGIKFLKLIGFTKKLAEDFYDFFLKCDTVLGLNLDEPITFEIPAKVQKLVIDRDKARKEKDWKKSDELRSKIEIEGFIVKDTSGGTEVQPK